MKFRFATPVAGALFGCAVAAGCVEAPRHRSDDSTPTGPSAAVTAPTAITMPGVTAAFEGTTATTPTLPCTRAVCTVPSRPKAAHARPESDGPVHCSGCAIDCFLLHDNLDPVDGGLGDAGNGTTVGDGGGLSLVSTTQIMPDAYVFDPSPTCSGMASPSHSTATRPASSASTPSSPRRATATRSLVGRWAS